MGAFGVVEKEDVAVYNEIMEKWGKEYFGKELRFEENHKKALDVLAQDIHTQLHLRMIAVVKNPRVREEALERFVQMISKKYGVDLDSSKIASMLNNLDWSSRERVEWTISNILAAFVVAQRLFGEKSKPQDDTTSGKKEESQEKRSSPQVEERREQAPAQERAAPPEKKPKLEQKVYPERTLEVERIRIFSNLYRELLKDLMAGKQKEVSPELLKEAREKEPMQFLLERGFSEKEAQEILAQHQTLNRLNRAIGGKEIDLAYYLALVAELREQVFGKKQEPVEVKKVEPPAEVKEETEEVKQLPSTPAEEPAVQEMPERKVSSTETKEAPPVEVKQERTVQVEQSQAPKAEVRSEQRSYRIMMFVANVLNPELYKPESDFYYLYGKTFLEIFNEMFGTNARSLEELKRMLKKDGDIQQWALDLIALLERYNAQDITLGMLKDLLEKVDNLIAITNYNDYLLMWRQLEHLKGIDLALALRGLDRGFVESVEPVPSHWQEVVHGMPVLSQYALISAITAYLPFLRDHYRVYEMKDGKYVLRAITDEDIVALVEFLANSRLAKHPGFFIKALPALIETSRTKEALEAKVRTVGAIVAGLEIAPKHRGLNYLVIEDYFGYVAETAYKSQATLVRDVKETLMGEKGEKIDNLANYFLTQAERVGALRRESLTVGREWLDLIGDVKNSAYGRSEGYGTAWDVEKAVDAEFQSTRPITPEATAYEPAYIVRGIATNLVPFTEFVPYRYSYSGNVWMDLVVSGEVKAYGGDVKESAGGAVVGRLVGTQSVVEGKLTVDGERKLDLSVIGRDLTLFNSLGAKDSDFMVRWDSAGVDAALKAELDKIGGNVVIVFRGRGKDAQATEFLPSGVDSGELKTGERAEKEIYIYYKDKDGNWYRVGRLVGQSAEEWLAEMDTYIPGFGKLFSSIRLNNQEGVFGVVGLDVGSLSVDTEFGPDMFSATAAYLLNPENLTIETLFGKREIPELVYAGYVQGTVISGGQAGIGNAIVAGDFVLGDVRGARLVYESAELGLAGVYIDDGTNNGLAFQAVAMLGGVEWLAKYAALNDRNTLVVKAKGSEGYVQFVRNYKYAEFARDQYVSSSQQVRYLWNQLLERYGGDVNALRAALQNPDSLDESTKVLVSRLQDALRKSNTYAMFVNSQDYMSFVANGNMGFVEVIKTSFGGDVYLINAAYQTGNLQVGAQVGFGAGTVLGGHVVYSSPEIAAMLKIYHANLSGYDETAVKALLSKRIERGEWGGIASAIFKRLPELSFNQYLLGVYYSENRYKVQVLATYEQSTLGDSVGVGAKVAYRISNYDQAPLWISGSVAKVFGANSGYKISGGLSGSNFSVEGFYAQFEGIEGWNEGIGIKAEYRFTW